MAVFPVASGGGLAYGGTHPDYSGKIIPTLWAKKFLERFYDATVLSAISQTDYEGEIKGMGEKVTISQIPDITISTYDMGTALAVQRPTQTTLDLLIDQGKYWQFILDDVLDAQAFTSMLAPWAENASERMKIVVDTAVLLGTVSTATATTNRGATAGRISANINLGISGTPVVLTKTNVIDYIIDHGQVLDEQNCPETGRKMVIPAWMAALIKKSDLKDASISGDGVSIARNGRLGMIDRYELYVSNLLPMQSVNSYVFSMHPKALTFASQLTKTETLRSEATFGTLMRGLMVYGYKTVLPTLLSEGVVVKG